MLKSWISCCNNNIVFFVYFIFMLIPYVNNVNVIIFIVLVDDG